MSVGEKEDRGRIELKLSKSVIRRLKIQKAYTGEDVSDYADRSLAVALDLSERARDSQSPACA